MALVTFFISPFDDSKKIEITSKGTLRYAMRELGIENDPVCVVINGMCPDEIDLETVLEDTDIVEIRHLVHGGGRSEDKSNLATVINIVALAVAIVYPPAALYVLVGSSLASGALNKWAADLAAAETGTGRNEVDVKANNYSLNTAANQVRPLEPLPIPMGSHRMAPDVYTDVLRKRYDVSISYAFASPLKADFQPGLISSNGPDAPSNSWATMPANYIAPGLPKYEIKIAPFGFVNQTTPLDSSQNSYIINQVKNSYAGEFGNNNFNCQMDFITLNQVRSFPIVIYHSSSSDPWYRRFNTIFNLFRLEQASDYKNKSNRYEVLMGNIFDGTVPSVSGPRHFFNNNFSTFTEATWLLRISSATYGPYIQFLDYNDTNSDTFTFYGNFMKALNGGSYNTSPKTTVPVTYYYVFDFAPTSIKEGIPYGTQIFNYGIGDLTISDRKVGTMDITSGSINSAAVSPVNKTSGDTFIRWGIPAITGIADGIVSFKNTVYNHQPKKLINPNFNVGLVSPYDNNPYNWIYFSGKPGQTEMSFAITGQVYFASGSGISNNTTRLQMHIKWSNSELWTEYTYPVMTITNNKTNFIYLPYVVNPSQIIGGLIPANYDELSLQVRIRKITLDSDDNANNRVSNLTISDIAFYTEDLPLISHNERNAPNNIEGLYLSALASDVGSTSSFSSLVRSKCWVFNFSTETWTWTFSRNPAFWFLYFARGGFFNYQSMGAWTYPYSPTYGWQNYANHPNNTEIIFGGGYTDDELDMDKILEWAFFCETEGLTFDMIHKDVESVSSTLEKIANSGRASVTYYEGKLSVVYEDPMTPATCVFGMGNIIAGSFSVIYSLGEPLRKIVGTFINRETWESDQVESLVPFADSDTIKDLEITFSGITDKANAQREVNILAARQFYQKRTYKWSVDFEGFLVRRGDVAYLAHDSTQYGYSGRISEFVVEAGTVIGIKTTAQISDVIEYITIRDPAGGLNTFQASFQNGMIVFNEPYPINMAPYYVNLNDINASSDFDTEKSIAEDFVFIADIKATPGKKVRISGIEVDENNVFTITAVDEDPAMWAYEYDGVIPSESFDDSILLTKVFNAKSLDLGQGNIKLLWETEGAEFIQIINVNTGLPLEANGQYSFSGGEVVLELISGIQYELELRPIAMGTAYRSTPQRIKVWPK